ncbi:MAG: hypothetical protein MZV70_63540 [Desulfobacterales bacterium]|nr:hypothetical protein [Desulfobacterales bacterium]
MTNCSHRTDHHAQTLNPCSFSRRLPGQRRPDDRRAVLSVPDGPRALPAVHRAALVRDRGRRGAAGRRAAQPARLGCAALRPWRHGVCRPRCRGGRASGVDPAPAARAAGRVRRRSRLHAV